MNPRREVDTPSYRVYFWKQQPRGAYESEEYPISDADVREVLSWADRRAGNRTYVLYARVVNRQGPGLVRLAGIDPTAQPLPLN